MPTGLKGSVARRNQPLTIKSELNRKLNFADDLQAQASTSFTSPAAPNRHSVGQKTPVLRLPGLQQNMALSRSNKTGGQTQSHFHQS